MRLALRQRLHAQGPLQLAAAELHRQPLTPGVVWMVFKEGGGGERVAAQCQLSKRWLDSILNIPKTVGNKNCEDSAASRVKPEATGKQ